MIYRGALNKRDGELQVYLFDHAILFAKLVKGKQHEQFKVYRRVSVTCLTFIFNIHAIVQPIPLELLLITTSEDAISNGRSTVRHRQGLVKKSSFSKDSRGPPHLTTVNVRPPEAKGQFWINFMHLGRQYYSLVLSANSQLTQRKWLENIYKQQQVMRDRSSFFDTVPLSEGFFTGPNKVNCAAPYRKC